MLCQHNDSNLPEEGMEKTLEMFYAPDVPHTIDTDQNDIDV
jgi:hypothetical protein